MTKQTKWEALQSTVIGFWRGGASVPEIIRATRLYRQVIKNIIDRYKNNK